MKHLKIFETAAAFEAAQATLDRPNVSLIETTMGLNYAPYIPPSYNVLDILYSDSNGNLSVSNQVLATSEGKTPIALCIAGTGFFGTGEKARWASLKYMYTYEPEVGSTYSRGVKWGNYNNDILTINNLQITYNEGPTVGYMNVDYYDNSSQTNKLPSVLNLNNEWNISVLGTVNTYVMTDIDGKNKTEKILVTATAQSTWETDERISNEQGINYAPAACCCARYHTLGTQAGDWYLGACGEMCMITAQKTNINTKLSAIATLYPNDCVSSFDNAVLWTSTEYNHYEVYRVSTLDGDVGRISKTESQQVLALLQY